MWGLRLDVRHIVLFFHVASVIVGMGTAVFFHLQFLRRKLRWHALSDLFRVGSRVIWVALGCAIITGTILWLRMPFPPKPIFYVKIALVGVILIEGLVIHMLGKPRLALLRPDQGFHDLPKEHRRLFYLSGALSVLGWWGALFIAIVA